MKTQVEVLEGNKAQLTVTIDAEEVNKRIKKCYKDFAHKYKFPGFRPGKAPRPVIDNALGKSAVVATVTDQLVNEVYPLAIDENNLFTLGTPKFGPEDLMAVENQELVFTVDVELVPEYELSSYEPVQIELPSMDVTDEEVDAQLDNLAGYYFDFKEAGATSKLKDGQFVELTIVATDKDGNALEALNCNERLYEVGSGLFPKAFDAEIIGMKKNTETSFDLDLTEEPSMLGASLGDKAGQVHFDVKLGLIKNKVKPEITDEWAQDVMGFESLEDLKTNVKDSLKAQKENLIPRMKESECLYALQERLQGEVPENLVEESERELLQNFFTQLQQQGQSFDAYLAQEGMTPDQFKEDIKKQARDIAMQDAAIDAWARHAQIEVTDEDITREFELYGQKDAAKIEKEWRATGRIHLLRRSIARTRAVMEIMEGAVVSEKKAESSKPATKKSSKKAEKPAETESAE